MTGAELLTAYAAGQRSFAFAYLGGANLRDANLRGANLGGADLRGANLGGAYLGGATAPNGRRCLGERPYAEVGPIGSRSDRLVVWLTEGQVYVVAGCWHSGDAEDGLTALAQRVSEVHGDSEHGVQYLAAIDYLRTHVALWADAVEREETER